MKTFLLIGLLFIGLNASGQHLQDIHFDISKVPFSRYGSYMALSTSNHNSDEKNILHLDDLTGKNVFSYSGILNVQPTEGQQTIAVEYEATPLSITGKTSAGSLIFYFESPERLHILSNGPSILVTGNIDKNNTLPIPGFEKAWKLRDDRVVLTVKSGTGGFQLDSASNGFFVKPDNGTLDVVIEQYKSDWLPVHYTVSYQQSMDELKKELVDWENKTPSVPQKYEQARLLAAYINWSCVVKPRGNIDRYGMLMSKNWMYNIWGWDNCFNALSLSYHQPKLSWDQYMVVFDQQDTATGAIPDYINPHHMVWEYRKPPIHGWTLEKLMQQYQLSHAQLADVYGKLVKWTNYWFIYRDGNKNGLPEYYHGDDAGWDNSTALDIDLPAESPDLAAFLVKQMDVLSSLAKTLGRTKESAQWKTKGDSTLQRMIRAFWNGDKFVSKSAVTGVVNASSHSLMSYLPLLLGNRLPENIRNKMIADLKKPGNFVTPYGLASESPESELYVSDGYWRGPVWAPPVLLIIDGLMQLHETDFARRLAISFCDACVRSGFAENFNAETGEPLRDPAYSWTSSVFLILAHDYVGNKL